MSAEERELLAELADLGLKKWDPAQEKSQRGVSGAEKLRKLANALTQWRAEKLFE